MKIISRHICARSELKVASGNLLISVTPDGRFCILDVNDLRTTGRGMRSTITLNETNVRQLYHILKNILGE